MEAVMALVSHVTCALCFVVGLGMVADGWGQDPVLFAFGLVYLALAAVFVWLTANGFVALRIINGEKP